MPAVTSVQTSVFPREEEPKFLVGGLRADASGNTLFGLTGGFTSALGEQRVQSRLNLMGGGTKHLTANQASAFRKQDGDSVTEAPGDLASGVGKQCPQFFRKSTDHSATVPEKNGMFGHGREPGLPATPRQAAAKTEGRVMGTDAAEINSLWPVVDEEGEA